MLGIIRKNDDGFWAIRGKRGSVEENPIEDESSLEDGNYGEVKEQENADEYQLTEEEMEDLHRELHRTILSLMEVNVNSMTRSLDLLTLDKM